MKLSELKGERAVIAIADLIEPITNIAIDQKNLKLFVNKQREGESDEELGMREIKEKVPNLIRTHKDDVLKILCVINDCEPESLSMIDIIKGTVDLFNDKEFLGLFLSVNKTADKTQPIESSEIAEHSEPEQ